MGTAVRTLLHVFSTFAVGGPQVRFAMLANQFGARYRHVIVAMDNVFAAAGLLREGVPFELRRLDFDKRDTLANLRLFRRVIRESGAALMITYNWGATEWGLANLTGLVGHVHIEDGFGPEETARQLPRRVWFRRLALARARAVCMPSRTLYRIAAETWRLPRRRLLYIPNGIDCARFAAPPDSALLDQLGLADGAPLVGTVAALRPEKNIGRLIRAFARALPSPARLVIVGDGPERAALAALAEAQGLAARVVFAGHQAPERLLGALDLYALSSDTEQMPISLLEAMAAGLAVAAVDVGDVRAMLAPENAPQVVAKDDAALGDALARLLRDPALRRRLGVANAARARAEFDQARMFAAYDALYSGERPAATALPELTRTASAL